VYLESLGNKLVLHDDLVKEIMDAYTNAKGKERCFEAQVCGFFNVALKLSNAGLRDKIVPISNRELSVCEGMIQIDAPLDEIRVPDASKNKYFIYASGDHEDKNTRVLEKHWSKILRKVGFKTIKLDKFIKKYSDKTYSGGFAPVFHGSPNKYEVLNPSYHPYVDKKVVFASYHYPTAVAFSFGWSNYSVLYMTDNISGKHPDALVEMYPGAFDKLKAKSYIYHLSDKYFVKDPRTPIYMDMEVVSFNEVQPIKVDEIIPLNYFNSCNTNLLNFNGLCDEIFNSKVIVSITCFMCVALLHEDEKNEIFNKLNEVWDMVYINESIIYNPSPDCVILCTPQTMCLSPNVRFIGKKYLINNMISSSDEDYFAGKMSKSEIDQYVSAWIGVFNKLDFVETEIGGLVNQLKSHRSTIRKN
jgi:hypothetical protein